MPNLHRVLNLAQDGKKDKPQLLNMIALQAEISKKLRIA